MNRSVRPVSSLGWLASLLGAGLLLGCGGQTTPKQQAVLDTKSDKDESLDAAIGPLQERSDRLQFVEYQVGASRDDRPEDDPSTRAVRSNATDVRENDRTTFSACRGAVQQLNVYLERNPELKPTPRADREHFGLDSGDWAEVNSTTFTPLDVHYLDECFLFRDVVEALQLHSLPPVRRAETVFAWTIRQVRLAGREGEEAPPAFILRRGSGSAAQRTQVFIALLHQLELNGCLVAFPGKETILLPGVLIGKEIVLFDPRLGLPLPGLKDGTAATLSQLRTQPELLKKLTIDPAHPYDLTPEQIQKAEVHLTCPLSALAPRMKLLQRLLASKVRIGLTVDSASVEQKFQTAAKESGVTFVGWNGLADARVTARVLRQFLLPREGGVDAPRPMMLLELRGYLNLEDKEEGHFQIALPSEMRFQWEQIPWTTLPPQVRALPPNSEMGRRTRHYEIGGRYLHGRRLTRETMLHGHYEEASKAAFHLLDTLKKGQQAREQAPNLNDKVNEWLQEARSAEANLIQAREAESKGKGSKEDVESAFVAFDALWRGSPMTVLCLSAINAPLSADTTYTLALCKHEQAERLQRKLQNSTAPADLAQLHDAWQAAADWWWTYTSSYSTYPAALSAQCMRARTLEGLGKSDEARTLWESLGKGQLDNPSAPLTKLERTACLYRARQLQSK